MVDIIEDGLAHVCLLENSTARTGRVVAGRSLSMPQLPSADFERLTLPGHGALSGRSTSGNLPILPIQGPTISQREAHPSPRSLAVVPIGHPILDAFQPLPVGTSRLVTCGNGEELRTHLLQTALAALAGQQSANPIHVVFVSIGGSTGRHAATDATLKSSSKRVTHVSAPSSAPLGQRYMAPFTGLACAQELARQGRQAVLVIADLTAHADAARHVAGVSWGNMMAAPTNTGALFDAACLVKHGGGVTVLAGAVGTPSGGPGIPHTGGGSAEAGAAGRGQGMLANRSVNPSAITQQETKGQEWLDQTVSLALSSYHLYGNSAADAAVGHLPVPEEVLSWANGHKAQGAAMCIAASSTLGLLRELRATATQACTALEYGISPEADQDRKLAFYAKVQLLLNPSARLLHEVSTVHSSSHMSEARLGLIAADASEQALAFFESTQEAAQGKAEPIKNFSDPANTHTQPIRSSTPSGPTASAVPWLKVDRASWLSMIPGFSGAGQRKLHIQAAQPTRKSLHAAFSSNSGSSKGSKLDEFASRMTPEQLQALRAAQAKRKPRAKVHESAGSTRSTAVSKDDSPNPEDAAPSSAASQAPDLIGNAAAAPDDFDDLIAALERGGLGDEAGEQATPKQPPHEESAQPAHSAADRPAGRDEPEDASASSSSSPMQITSLNRTFFRLFLIASGALTTVPVARVLEFEQVAFDILRKMSTGAAASLTGCKLPPHISTHTNILDFSREEQLTSDVHLTGDFDVVFRRARVAPWNLADPLEKNANILNYVVFAIREDFLN